MGWSAIGEEETDREETDREEDLIEGFTKDEIEEQGRRWGEPVGRYDTPEFPEGYPFK